MREPGSNETNVAGVSVDMAAIQEAVLNDVLNGSIRSQVASVAQNLWQNKTAASLTPLQGIFNNAVNAYTQELTTAATSIQSAINAALQSQAAQARNGNIDLLNGEVQQSTLGWTAAGAYYLEIAKANATTLSLLNATPVTTAPTYDGLGPALSYDLAPLETALHGIHDDAADGRANDRLAPSRPPVRPKPLPTRSSRPRARRF